MWVALDADNKLPLARQLYEHIKKMIWHGDMTAGEKLPSSRALSRELGVSRNTVLEAYDQLIAEGYLNTRHGSGTVVAEGIATGVCHEAPVSNDDDVLLEKTEQPTIVNFRSGIPALAEFPQAEWARTYQQRCATLPASAFGYCEPAGVWELREAIARYLFRSRGIRCPPQRIMITSGSTQGLSLVARLLYRQGAEVAVEDPVHTGLVEVVARAGYIIRGIAADDDGMETSRLDPSSPVAFVYTTPSHQYPLGGILPVQRRLDLIRFARQTGCYVVEDDYDSEFRYEGHPVSSLYELEPEKVIYLGSFSKILAPALRLGFALLPEALLDAWKPEKMYADVHTDALSQYALAAFIDSGALERHIWKMKKLYKRKREHLIEALSCRFHDRVTLRGHAAGLHVVAGFRNVNFNDTLVGKLLERGVKVVPVEKHSIGKSGAHSHEIILGYAHLPLDAITEGVHILGEVLKGHG